MLLEHAFPRVLRCGHRLRGNNLCPENHYHDRHPHDGCRADAAGQLDFSFGEKDVFVGGLDAGLEHSMLTGHLDTKVVWRQVKTMGSSEKGQQVHRASAGFCCRAPVYYRSTVLLVQGYKFLGCGEAIVLVENESGMRSNSNRTFFFSSLSTFFPSRLEQTPVCGCS